MAHIPATLNEIPGPFPQMLAGLSTLILSGQNSPWEKESPGTVPFSSYKLLTVVMNQSKRRINNDMKRHIYC